MERDSWQKMTSLFVITIFRLILGATHLPSLSVLKALRTWVKQSESEAAHLLLSTANVFSKILGPFLPNLRVWHHGSLVRHWDHFASIIIRDYVRSDSRTNAPSVRAASVVKTEEILTAHRVLEAIQSVHCDPGTFRFSIHRKATAQNLPSPAET